MQLPDTLWGSTDVLFCCSAALRRETVQELAELCSANMKQGSFFVLTNCLLNAVQLGFVMHAEQKQQMSWGPAMMRAYQKL